MGDLTARESGGLDKVVRLGTIVPSGRKRPVSVFAHVQYRNGRLSITGVEGPLPSGNCAGSAGQIDMDYDTAEARADLTPAPGWTAELIDRFFDVWDRWHLNDMRAGSPRQRAWLAEHPVKSVYPQSHYVEAGERLARVGLNPDTEYLHDGKPYTYGSAWLSEDVPQDVIDFLAALPDADRKPAWV